MTHDWCPFKPENEQADVYVLMLRLACTVFFHSAAVERLCDCRPSCGWWIRWCTMRSEPIHVFIRGGPVRTDFQLLCIPGTHIWNEWLQLKGSLEAARWSLLMDCGTFFGFFSGDTVDVEDKTVLYHCEGFAAGDFSVTHFGNKSSDSLFLFTCCSDFAV